MEELVHPDSVTSLPSAPLLARLPVRTPRISLPLPPPPSHPLPPLAPLTLPTRSPPRQPSASSQPRSPQWLPSHESATKTKGSKRCRERAATSADTSPVYPSLFPALPSSTPRCRPLTDSAASLSALVSVLSSVRQGFHAFLSDEDAARILRVNCRLTSAALHEYRFTQHLFCAESGSQLQRMVGLYERYHMRILLLHFSFLFNDPLMDTAGRSLLPSSLIALALGHVPVFMVSSSIFAGVVSTYTQQSSSRRQEVGRQQQLSHTLPRDRRLYTALHGEFKQPLVQQALPEGLKFLALSANSKQKLEVGMIPRSVVFLLVDAGSIHLLSEELMASLPHVKLLKRRGDVGIVGGADVI